MRIKAVLVLAALAASAAATALPASAQGYARTCNASKNANQVGGAIVGGLLGGVLGSNVAAKGHKHDGTALGAVLGGVVGAGIGGSSTNCSYSTAPQDRGPLPPPPGTYAPGYGYNDGYGQGQGYNGQYSSYPADPGYSSGYGYDDDPYYRDRSPRHDPVYVDGNRGYRDDGYAGEDCSTAIQTTRLPDGTVIKRPVEACREAYYGDWRVRN